MIEWPRNFSLSLLLFKYWQMDIIFARKDHRRQSRETVWCTHAWHSWEKNSWWFWITLIGWGDRKQAIKRSFHRWFQSIASIASIPIEHVWQLPYAFSFDYGGDHAWLVTNETVRKATQFSGTKSYLDVDHWLWMHECECTECSSTAYFSKVIISLTLEEEKNVDLNG